MVAFESINGTSQLHRKEAGTRFLIRRLADDGGDALGNHGDGAFVAQ